MAIFFRSFLFQLQNGTCEDLTEDGLTNQIVGMVVSLQCLACVSPVCEWPVVAMVTGAVGKGHIDSTLVIKVGNNTVPSLTSCYSSVP